MSRRPDRLARCHALSGLLISLYAALHLMNHAAAIGGPFSFSHLRALLRRIYQFPAYEVTCLAAPILFNVISGFWMLARRSSAEDGSEDAAVPGIRKRLHRWSGVCLIGFLVPHALSTRGAALMWNIEPDFHFVARTLFGIRGSVFWLIYGILVVATAYHMSNGLFTFLDELGAFRSRWSRRAAAAAFVLVGTTLMLCGLLGLSSYGGAIFPRPSVETLPAE